MNKNMTLAMKLKKYDPGFLWRLYRIRRGKLDPMELTIYLEKYYGRLTMDELKLELARAFHSRTGETLDLEHPVTLNQKVQWLKLNENSPEKSRLADKNEARDWVAETIGGQYLTRRLGVYDRFDDIPFDALPDRFALKCTSGSGMNHIVHDKSRLDMAALKKECDGWLRRNYGYTETVELHYRAIVPRIMVEEYLENVEGDLYDYKVHCFGGVPRCVQVVHGRFGVESMEFYDLDWKPLGFVGCSNKDVIHIGETERPAELDELLDLARRMSKDFTYVRVDFYVVKGHIYFGEMTFTPAAGFLHWDDQRGNQLMGSWLDLPIRDGK